MRVGMPCRWFRAATHQQVSVSGYQVIAAVVLVVLGAGCTSREQFRYYRDRGKSPKQLSAQNWTHETKSDDDFTRDSYECERENRSGPQASEYRDRCMLLRGWQRK